MTIYDIDKYGTTNIKSKTCDNMDPNFLYSDENDTSKHLYNPSNVQIPIDGFRSQIDIIFESIDDKLSLDNYNELKTILEKIIFIFFTSIEKISEKNLNQFYKYFKIQNWPKNNGANQTHCNLKQEFLISPQKNWEEIKLEYRLNDEYTNKEFISENYIPQSKNVLLATFDTNNKLIKIIF